MWVAVTPVGAFGDWQQQPVVEMAPRVRAALFAGFDPFYRTAPAQTDTRTVTGLTLQLFGTRVNQASGGGSAIIAGPDGVQSSYAVGDAIVSGVTLKAVAVDHVVLTHAGSDELLFLDQSKPAPLVVPDATSSSLRVDRIRTELSLVPRAGAGGAVTGIAVSPAGSGKAFAQAGFRAGDVIVSIDGRPVRSPGDLQAFVQALNPGAQVALQVERGGVVVPLALVLPN
jgi:general secretion pathway protein C